MTITFQLKGDGLKTLQVDGADDLGNRVVGEGTLDEVLCLVRLLVAERASIVVSVDYPRGAGG